MIKLTKICSVVSLATVAALSITGCASKTAHQSLPHLQHHPATSNHVPWMFVISAPTAQFKQLSDKKAVLIANGSKFDRSIMFTDKPQRYVKYITFTGLKHTWAAGYHNFVDQAPEAMLVAPTLPPTVVKLDGYHINGDKITFTVTNLRNNQPFPKQTKRFMMLVSPDKSLDCGRVGSNIIATQTASVHELPSHDQFALTVSVNNPAKVATYANQPNAVLSAGNLRPLIAVIKGVHKHAHSVTFDIEAPAMLGIPSTLNKMSLAIDSGCHLR